MLGFTPLTTSTMKRKYPSVEFSSTFAIYIQISIHSLTQLHSAHLQPLSEKYAPQKCLYSWVKSNWDKHFYWYCRLISRNQMNSHLLIRRPCDIEIFLGQKAYHNHVFDVFTRFDEEDLFWESNSCLSLWYDDIFIYALSDSHRK